ncbi:MAG: sulfatase-like hydrolase/transferase, partial [Verrucomicrobiae bacterium]|nr:sulfatase-like hydrolase/transferase [Verrucomicrobiae bacterium]
KPFLLYLPQVMPHKPLACSEEFYKKSGDGLYADVIAELDNQIGELFAALKRLGLDEKTLVVFTSDNGPWFGGSTGGLRGMKSTAWEGGYRVPCIARWPGRIPAGHVSHAPAITMDLFTTALKAAGIAPPDDRVIDGKDIMPLFTSDAKSPHEAVFGQRRERLAVVCDERWKLHVLPPTFGFATKPGERWIDPRGPDGVTILAPYEQYQPTDHPGLQTGDAPVAMMLFDLQNDPGEQHNVASQHPEVVARLKLLYDRMNKDVPPPSAPAKKKGRTAK